MVWFENSESESRVWVWVWVWPKVKLGMGWLWNTSPSEWHKPQLRFFLLPLCFKMRKIKLFTKGF